MYTSKPSASAYAAVKLGISGRPASFKKSLSVGVYVTKPMSRPFTPKPNRPSCTAGSDSRSPSGRSLVSVGTTIEDVSMPVPTYALTPLAPIIQPDTSRSVIVPPLLVTSVEPRTSSGRALKASPKLLWNAGPRFCGTPVPRSTSICGPISKPKLPSRCTKSNRLTRPYSSSTPMRWLPS